MSDVIKTVRPKTIGDLVVFETEPNFTTELVTALAGSEAVRPLAQFAVLGKITASGKYVALAPAASDGSQNAGAINIKSVSVPDGADLTIAVKKRGPMIVRAEELVWPAGITTNQKNSAIAQLEALNILVRASG